MLRKEISLFCMAIITLSIFLGNGAALGANISEKEKGEQDKHSISVYLAGDSTVSNYSSSLAPRAGWGQVFDEMFDKKVVVKNHASSGRSSKSFMEEGKLTVILNQIEKGDYLFIQFGHNDQKIDDTSRYTEPYTTYKTYLRQYIDGAFAKGAHPVLVTPVERRRFTEDGKAKDSLGEYPKAMKELGQELDVPVIDLTEKSKALYEKLGPEETKNVFLWLEEGENPNYPNGVQDNTHFQERGARLIAQLVANEINESKLQFLQSHLILKRENPND